MGLESIKSPSVGASGQSRTFVQKTRIPRALAIYQDKILSDVVRLAYDGMAV